jgi:hypothetical protein
MHKIIPTSIVTLCLIAGIPCAYCETGAHGRFEYESKGKRDPFIPLIGQENPKISNLGDITSIEDIRVDGIAMGAGGKNIAILNGQVVKDNDKFGAVCIKRISQKAVQLSIEEKDYTVRLQGPGEGNKSGKE